jgi:hypothetical protein
MKTKTIVIGCVGLVLLAGTIALCVVGGIFLLGLSGHADQAEKDGVDFGKGTDQAGCLHEAQQRLKVATKSGDFIKRRETQLFLNGCFQTSRGTAGFCDNAPKADNFLDVRKWSQERCTELGAGNDDACVSLYMEVSDACLGKTKKKAE